MGKLGGRPRGVGEREANGRHKRKPSEGFTPAMIGRIKNALFKAANDPRLENQIGIMIMQGEFTNAQAAAAYKVGDVYRAFHRAKAQREFPKSPNYERGYGDADIAEERMSPEQLSAYEESIEKATEAWNKVDGYLAGERREVRQAVVDVCVFSTPCRPDLIPDLRRVLDDLAKRWAENWRIAPKQHHKLELVHVSTTTVEMMPRPRRDTITEPLEQVVRSIRPDLDDDGVRLVIDTFHALRARKEFRDKKSR